MMRHSDADREIKAPHRMRQRQSVSDKNTMGRMARCDPREVERAVGGEDEDGAVHGEVFAVAAADVEAD